MLKQLKLILLAAALWALCAGCSWMDGSYVSVTPHQMGYSNASDDMAVIRDYSGLRSAITGLIDTGAAEGLFTLLDYPENNLSEELDMAVAYARYSYPIGAFAVDSIDYEYGTGAGQNALSVEITYRRSKSEIDRIRTVRGIPGAQNAIAEALSNCQDSLILQITTYKDTDFIQLIADYAAEHPNVVMELPQTTARLYPDRGDVRVLELQFSYQTSRDSLRYMQSQVKPVFSSAVLYVSGESDDATKYAQLYNFLMERFDYSLQTSITPTYSLLSHGVGDSRAFAQVWAAMCRQAGLEAMTVSGTYNGESRFWNIIRVEDVHYHVDLLQGSYQPLGDDQMTGYVWDYSAYPACGEALPPETETTEPETTENPG